jgi:putative Ca2+/H+ antiporter (TMEM165/GDT1 family)
MAIGATVFVTLLLAELGDKTQIATLLFSSAEAHSPWAVFAGASAALVAASGLAVLIGHYAGHYLTALPIPLIAGCLFVALGVTTIVQYIRG